jgi:hypothetical protein
MEGSGSVPLTNGSKSGTLVTLRLESLGLLCSITVGEAADPHYFQNADPAPVFHVDAYPDPDPVLSNMVIFNLIEQNEQNNLSKCGSAPSFSR